MAVYDLAHKLAEQLQKADEYQEYKKLRQEVLNDENTHKMLLEYQDLSLKVNSAKAMGQETNKEDEQRLEKLQELIGMNNTARRYLEAESRIGIMLQDIQKIMVQNLDLGLAEENREE